MSPEAVNITIKECLTAIRERLQQAAAIAGVFNNRAMDDRVTISDKLMGLRQR